MGNFNELFDAYQDVRAAIDSGELILVEYMSAGWVGVDLPSQIFLQQWHNMYPHPSAIVAADFNGELSYHLNVGGIPHFAFIGPEFTWTATVEGLDAAQAWLQ